MPNMELIQAITVGSGGAANIEFTSIPQTYTDLVIKVSARTNRAAPVDGVNIAFNGSTSSFTGRYLESDGSSAYSGTSTRIAASAVGNTATATTFGNGEIYIPNYTSSNNKSFSGDTVTENNATPALADLIAVLWSNTSAITSIALTPLIGTTFDQYSTAYLYGITNVTSSAKATGGTITSDGAYFYHTFTSSGTFTPTQSLTADYLVVAGGAGGYISGGGAGGLRSTVTATGGGGSLETPLSLTAQAYTVTVGAGGAVATDGNNSVFSTITSNKGGNGGSNGSGNGGTVTSGAAGTSVAGAAGTANQGYAGGTSTKFGSTTPTYWGGAGGGGANAIGGAGRSDSNPATSAGGNGGNGVAVAISGTSVTYAGGGGGYNEGNTARATGGSGGGGDADNSSNTGGTAGTANTGGGGGGRSAGGGGYAGGSGLVIIRYAV